MVFLIAAINFLSAFLQASTGFGYAILAMFLMPFFLPYRQCLIISASLIIIIAVQMCYSLRAHIRIKKILWPMLWCLSTLWIGVWLIRVLDASTMRKIMGVFLILLGAYFYTIKRFNICIKESWLNGMIIGILTGLATGMFNIIGPFLTLYYFDNMDSTLEIKANLEFSFMIGGITSLVMNLADVPLDTALLQHIALSGAAAILAGFIGLKIYHKINKAVMKYIIIGVLPLMGVVQILK